MTLTYNILSLIAVKRPGPGRPRGSGNKAKAQSDEDYTPPNTRKRARERSECPAAPVEIPEVFDWELEIPRDARAACSKCCLNKAIYIITPCYHYGWCNECLTSTQRKLRDEGKGDECIACGISVESYLKCFRQTHNHNNGEE